VTSGREWLALAVVAAPLAGAVLAGTLPRRLVQPAALVVAAGTAGVSLALAAVALGRPAQPFVGRWLVVDAAGGLLVAVIGVVGFASAFVSPAYLRSTESSLVRPAFAPRLYYGGLALFQATLLAVPLAGNLGAAWLLLEATGAFSALLVGFSGKRRALEAAWKYLILTSLGLGVTLLGIAVLESATGSGRIGGLSWSSIAAAEPARQSALVAYALLLIGLAAKAGWAPVHNWLPDAHSEGPPPVSALLSGALLPAVALVAWRVTDSLEGVVGAAAHQLLIAFGLVSLAVAIPFLWRALAWKRLLAYSSLEHMGVIALGIGFGSPLALAGVVIHVAGHAVAKALGFYAATPLIEHLPQAGRGAVSGVGRTEPALGAALGVSLAALSGMPPSPLFVSEVLVVAGGFSAGYAWAGVLTALLLALGFLGLAHALIEVTVGRARRHRVRASGMRGMRVIAACAGVLLLCLTGAALWLPESGIVAALARGLS
jgi:hydrogenase-4 component F